MRVVPDARVASSGQSPAYLEGLGLLHPEDQVFGAMLTGWRQQQLARRLAFSTIEQRERMVQAFAAHAQQPPWAWTAQHVDEWMTDLRAVRHVRASTMRGYQIALRLFCSYITDSAYDWPAQCQQRFGTHPIQVVNDWNSATHIQDAESDPARRAFTRLELQTFFDHADDQVALIRADGRKGWLPAFRDATLFKIAYAYGLRRNEVRMLEFADFGRNPHAPEYGDLGVCYVRHGKASRGSPPKRRSVLTVWPWTTDVLSEWISELRPAFADTGPSLWPTERNPRMGLSPIDHRFSAYRDALGLEPGLDFHSLRRSYVTHLIEDGWDALFVQNQVGHSHASTTAIYTCVSSDYRTRTLRTALDSTVHDALAHHDTTTPPSSSTPTRATGPTEDAR